MTGRTISGTMTRPIIIALNTPRPDEAHPCALGAHIWAWLSGGGQACGRCGTRRR